MPVASPVARQPEQRPEGGRLAGAVRAKEAVHLSGTNLEVEPVQRAVRTERLDEPPDVDHFVGHVSDPTAELGY
jgi:hypothetical protein